MYDKLFILFKKICLKYNFKYLKLLNCSATQKCSEFQKA